MGQVDRLEFFTRCFKCYAHLGHRSFCNSLPLMGQSCFNMLALPYTSFGQRWLSWEREIGTDWNDPCYLHPRRWLQNTPMDWPFRDFSVIESRGWGSASKRCLHSKYAVFSRLLCLFEVVREDLCGSRSELKTPPHRLSLWHLWNLNVWQKQ